MEPQMIRTDDNHSPVSRSHSHLEKLQRSQNAAVFKIERQLPNDNAKISSRYEIYDSNAKSFDGGAYTELIFSSSTDSAMSCCSSENHTSGTCSSTNGVDNSLGETTSYITTCTCDCKIEPVRMTGFHCIDDRSHRHTVSIYNEQCYDNINEATNYNVLASASAALHLDNDAVIDHTIDSFENNEKEIFSDTKSFANVAVSKIETDCDDARHAITIETWTTCMATDKPLKSPGLLRQIISAHGINDLRDNQSKPSTLVARKKKEQYSYTCEPLIDINSIKTAATKCRSMINLELKPPLPLASPQPIASSPSTTMSRLSKAVSEVNLNGEERQREKNRIAETISLMLENRRDKTLKEAARRRNSRSKNENSGTPPPVDDNVVEFVESSRTSDSRRGCRVTDELLKRDRTARSKTSISYADYHRNVFILPRSTKSHRTQLQRHFYHSQYVRKNASYRVPDEELPDPDKVQNARKLFERVLKIGSLKDVAISPEQRGKINAYATLPRPTPEIRQPSSALFIRDRIPRYENSTIDATATISSRFCRRRRHHNGCCQRSDDNALSDNGNNPESNAEGGAISDTICDTKEDVIFTNTTISKSEKDLFAASTEFKNKYDDSIDENLGKPISSHALDSIHAYGTSITYYGGKIITSSEGCSRSPMTMTIMNEIKRLSPDYRANYCKLFSKNNRRDNQLKLSSCTDKLIEQKRSLRLEDSNNNASDVVIECKNETGDTIKENVVSDEQRRTFDNLRCVNAAKQTRLWPNIKRTASLYECEYENNDYNKKRDDIRVSNMKNWLRNDGGDEKVEPYCDMQFEEFEVLEQIN